MTLSLLFWLLMLAWLILGPGQTLKGGPKGIGTALLPWACVAIVGWQVLGPLIR